MFLYAPLTDMVSEDLYPDLMLANITKLSEYRQILINYNRKINADLGNIPNHDNTAEIVQAHQVGLSELSNILFEFRRLLDKDNPSHQLVGIFYAAIARDFDHLLSFIVKEYPDAVNPKFPAPYSYVSLISIELSANIEKVLLQAQDKKIDPNLIALVLRPAKEIIDQKENRVPLWSLFYCRELLKSLLLVTGPEAADKEIYYVLMHLNFNSHECHRYCLRKLESKLEKQKDHASRMELLHTYETTIRIHPIKPGFAFHPGEDSWADQILTHIEALKVAVTAIPVKKEESETAGNIVSGMITKLNTSLTVHELAFMVRLYIDAGIITNVSPKEVMEFITTFLTTKKTRSLATPSFRTKYYKPSLATMRNCRNWFKKLQDTLSAYTPKDDN